MKKIFIKSKVHGELYYKSVYEYFDGPKIFSVISKRGDLFLVYWIDEEDTGYKWIYFEIKRSKLISLESQKIDIYNILEKRSSDIFFECFTPYSKKEKCVEKGFIGKISDHIIMPDTGLKISFCDHVINNDEQAELIESSDILTDYSIHIDLPKTSSRKIDFNCISPVFDYLEELFSDFLSIFNTQDKLVPILGKPGSFILDFNSSKFNLIESHLEKLSALMKSKGDIVPYIKQNNIPIQPLVKLLSHISEENLIIDLTNKHSESDFSNINKTDADFYLLKLKELSSLDLKSSQVPQADTLEHVYEIVENIWSNGYLVKDTLSLEDRHILYYTDAAKNLGFITNTGTVTAIGQQLMLASDDNKTLVSARAFENSHCGWTWIVWSGVDNLGEVNATSAKEFLDECANTLSESTKIRRARTLRNWCKKMQAVYRPWN
ncbi:DUF6575 domain-containing protein [Candidatus Pantoea formicae]|uniref:DUF6575 domain-containing protein n=1 Tax=Candidatus Pantoea formicae TaxID=2608355 RepID=UPI003EDAA0AD